MPEESGKYKIPLLPFEVRPEVVGRYALGGALTGAGAAAALNLVHLLRDLNKKREAAQQPAQTGKDTIVLTIPKRGEVKDKSSGMITKSTKAPQESTIMREMVSRNNQVIQDNGRYGMKTMMKKKADWPTLTASLLAAGGAGTLGYKLIDKLITKGAGSPGCQ